MDLSEVCARLDDRLRTDAYADLDASANGLQVGSARPDGTARADETAQLGEADRASDAAGREVEHVAFAVDAAVETAERAAAAGADLLVTHHGLVWGGLDRLTGRTHARLAPLFEHDLALYVSHLPLDGHPELGNAAGLCELLGLEDREPFGELGPEFVGRRGRLPSGLGVGELRALLEANIDHAGRGVQVLDFGPERVEEIAVVTGSGADWLDEAAAAGADAFVTGEGKGKLYHEAGESGLHVLLAGHYATETFGVRALKAVIAGWGLETTFLDAPTGL
jgi:dinuclear metal center YbgI/SA1388 family protein